MEIHFFPTRSNTYSSLALMERKHKNLFKTKRLVALSYYSHIGIDRISGAMFLEFSDI